MSCLNFGVIDSGTAHHEDVCPELGGLYNFFFRSILRNTYIQICIEVLTTKWFTGL